VSTRADVMEGSGGISERLHYDRSDPNRVVLTTTDSNLGERIRLVGNYLRLSPFPETGWPLEAASLPISSHIFVEASAHLLAVTPTAHWLEYLDLAGAILVEPHRPVGGTVIAKGLGLGIEWDESAIARFAMEHR
jgi:hypothetical protein